MNTPLHPPLAVVEVLNAAYAASTWACVWHAGTVTSVPQVNTTAGAAVIVNLLVHVRVTSHELV